MKASTVERHAHIQLPYVRRAGGPPLRDALSKRASCRSFDTNPLEAQTIADLLWAAFGINRPDEGGRTAPSARNWREIDIYVALREALYRYDPAENRLDFIAAGDLRAATGVQDFVAEAPLNLVYVADYAKMEGASEAERDVFAAADAAFIAQNAYLFCAAEGLATVVRALIDRTALAKAMGLKGDQHVVLAQSVGRPARER
jgi:SagB-type dehydrogenase family enzyme